MYGSDPELDRLMARAEQSRQAWRESIRFPLGFGVAFVLVALFAYVAACAVLR